MARPKAPPTRMQRSGNGHIYFLDGERVPGVTTILGNGIPKPGLMKWASGTVSDFVVNRLTVARNPEGKERIVADELVEDALRWNQTRPKPTPVSPGDRLPRQALGEILTNIRYRDLDEASGRGTEVHAIAERLAHGEEVEVPEPIKGHVASYVRFLDEWDPVDAVVEGIIINRRWRYMGKFDLLATIHGLPPWLADRIGKTSGRGLFDIKTARSGIYAETALQLEAYRRGETVLIDGAEEPMPDVDFVAAIHVRADGFDVYAFDIVTDTRPTTFDIFLYAKQVGDWLDWKEGPAATIKSPSLRKAHPA
jgi:hypothetical protein